MPGTRFSWLPAVRLTEREHAAVRARMAALEFGTIADYVRALLRADIPEMDPARKLRRRRKGRA